MERKTCIVERAMLVGLGVAWSIAPETCGTRFHRVAGDNNGSVVESNLIFRSEVGDWRLAPLRCVRIPARVRECLSARFIRHPVKIQSD